MNRSADSTTIAIITAAYNDDRVALAQLITELVEGSRDRETEVLMSLAVISGTIGNIFDSTVTQVATGAFKPDALPDLFTFKGVLAAAGRFAATDGASL